MVSRSVRMVECPEMEAHSPVEFRNAILMEGSEVRSEVLPDSVLVWKRRSMPPDSFLENSCQFVVLRC